MLNTERNPQAGHFAEFKAKAKKTAQKTALLIGAGIASVGIGGSLTSPASADSPDRSGFSSQPAFDQAYYNPTTGDFVLGTPNKPGDYYPMVLAQGRANPDWWCDGLPCEGRAGFVAVATGINGSSQNPEGITWLYFPSAKEVIDP